MRNRAAQNRAPASRMRVGLHGSLRSHAAPESRYPSLTKKASTAAFTADFGKQDITPNSEAGFRKKQLGAASKESVLKKLEINEKLRELDELHRMVDGIPPEILQAAKQVAVHKPQER